MNRKRSACLRRGLSLILVVICLTGIGTIALAAHPDGRYYLGKNGRYSFELSENNLCYWYQDGRRFAGIYEEDQNGVSMELVGSGGTLDTRFRAELQEDGSYVVSGGMVDGERFTSSRKLDQIREVDQQWAQRINKNSKSTGKIRIMETVLLDDADYSISAFGYHADGNDEGIYLLAENRSDEEVRISLNQFFINGILLENSIYFRLDPGETSRKEMSIDLAMLEAAEIEKIEEISVSFEMSGSGQTSFVSDPVSIPVLDGRSRVSTLIPINKTLVSSHGITGWLLGYQNLGYCLKLYYRIFNESEEAMQIRGDESLINGMETSALFLNENVNPVSDGFYSDNVYLDDYSSIGKLTSLDFRLSVVDHSYKTVAEAGETHFEFEPDGQLCEYLPPWKVQRNASKAGTEGMQETDVSQA